MKIGSIWAWIVILILTMLSVGIRLETTESDGAMASNACHSVPAKARNTEVIAADRAETPRPAVSSVGVPDGELASATAKRPMGDRSKGFESLSDAMSAAIHAPREPKRAELDLEINRDVRYWAANPAESMVARFLDGAVKMQSSLPGSAWSVTVKRPGPAPRLSVAGERVEYQHADGVLEWYENLPAGFHHGFTVPKPLRGSRSDEELRLQLEVDGLSVESDGESEDALCFYDGGGHALVGYRGLKAWDARGQKLDASMVPNGNGFMLVVNDRDAVYPVEIDPYYLNLEQSLIPTMTGTGSGNDNLGNAVAISGNTAVVAATGVLPGGRVYIFVNDGTHWNLETELWPSDGQSGDNFGCSVDLEGDTLVVGAFRADPAGLSDAGSAYVYHRNQGVWTLQSKLVSPYPASDGWFGVNVSLSGDDLAIGSYSNHVYMFHRSAGAWSYEEILAIGNYGFARSIALDGDTILIGAPMETVNLVPEAGVVYVWERRNGIWDEVDWFVAPTARYGDQFGSVLALDGDVAVIGAPYTDNGAGGQSDYGAAYIFRRSGDNWTQQAIYRGTMLPQDGFGERMGAAVSVSGDLVVVGTPGNLSAGLGVGGMANVYQWNGTSWGQKASLSYSPALVGDKFGNGVAVNEGKVIVGAPWHQGVGGAGDNFGSVFFYADAPSPFTWVPVQQWTEGNGKGGLQLGSAVALNGNTAVVGAPYESGMVGLAEGAAYVFVKSNDLWQEQARLVQPNPSSLLYFGRRVALDGNTVVVGSNDASVGNLTSRGRAEVFVRSGTSWSHQQTLPAPNQTAAEGFATGLAVLGDMLLVGAPYADNAGPGLNNGNVHAFKRTGTTWTQQQVITPTDKQDNQNFGTSVDIDGITAVIGARGGNTNNFAGAGRAYVFTTNGTTWSQQASLSAPTPTASAFFGTAVAIQGNTLVVGATGVDGPEATGFPWSNGGLGQAYAFIRSGTTWSHQATFNPEGTSQSTGFGAAVALHENYAVIGTEGQSAAYLFTRAGTTWTRQQKYQLGIPTNPGNFGASVAVEGETVMIGVPGANRTVPSVNRVFTGQGMVQIYRISTSSAVTLANGDGAALPNGYTEMGFDGTTSTRWISQTLTISNTSDAPMSGSALTVTGPQASMFAISGWSGPLAVGESRQLVVQFQPTVVGLCTAVLKIVSSNGNREVQLTGMGLTPREAFDRWAVGLADGDPDASPHHDGISNLVKYAFNLNGGAPDHRTLVPLTGVAGLPVGQIDRSGPSPFYRFEYLRRTGSGLVYTPERSSSLGSGTFTSPAGSQSIQPIDNEWERVVHQIPLVSGEACFVRVKVSLP